MWRVEVARILPELLTARKDLPRPAPMTEFGDRLRFFEGLARAALAAPQPLLLLIDDLQWCDRETLEWLHYLSRFDPARAPAGARHRALRGARRRAPAPDAAAAAAQRLAARRVAARAARRGRDGGARRAGRGSRLRRGRGDAPVSGDRGQSALHRGDGASRERRRFPGRPAAGDPGAAAPRARGDRRPPGPALRRRPGGRRGGGRDRARLRPRRSSRASWATKTVVVRALDELWRMRIVREQGPNAYDFTHDRLRDVAYGETSAPQRRLLAPARGRGARRRARAGPRSRERPARRALRERGPRRAGDHALRCGRRWSPRASAPTTRRWPSSVAASRCCASCPRARAATPWSSSCSWCSRPSYRVTLGWAAPSWARCSTARSPSATASGPALSARRSSTGCSRSTSSQGRLEKSALVTDEMVRLLRETPGAEPPRSAFAMLAGARLQMGRFQEALRRRRRAAAGGGLGPAAAPSGVAGPELRGRRAGLAVARALVPGPTRTRRSSGASGRAAPRARAAAAVQPGDRGDLPGTAPAAARRARHVPPAGRRGARALDGLQGDLLPGVGRDPRRLRGGRSPAADAAGARAGCGARSTASRRRGRSSACRTTSRSWRTRTAPGDQPAEGLDVLEEATAPQPGDERALVGLRAASPARPAAARHGRRAGRGRGGAQARARDRARAAGEVARAAIGPGALASLWAAAGRASEARELLAPSVRRSRKASRPPTSRAARALLSSLGPAAGSP